MSRRAKRASAEQPVKRCAIYTRKSTVAGLEQEFNTLHAQREACEQYIASQAHQGWQLVAARYDDGGYTGSNLNRPGFNQLMEAIDAGLVDIVVVYKVDRLSRSLLDFARIMDHFHQCGVSFVSVTQNFSTADAMGRLTLNMLMSFAEFEREMIAERTRDKIAAARRKGKWTGGLVPLGYDLVEKKLVINDLEAVVVRELFELYEQHQSALTVARLLNQKGRTTKVLQHASGDRRPGRQWTKIAVLRVLRNPIYAGLTATGDELYEGEHQAIVEQSRFMRIRALLETRDKETISHCRNPAYLLRGLLFCKLCNGALTSASSRKNDRQYRYYRCTTSTRHGKKACVTRPLPAEDLEAFVVGQLRTTIADGELAREVASRLKVRVQAQRKALRTEAQALPALIARLSAEQAALMEAVGHDSGASARKHEERMDAVSIELARHRERRKEVEQALGLLEQATLESRWVVEALANFDAVWDMMTLENRGRLLRAVVERVEIDEPGGVITATLIDLAPGKAEQGEPLPEIKQSTATQEALS